MLIADQLTPRELQIVRALAKCGSDKAIAREVGLTRNTVNFYMRVIYQKVGIHDRVLLAVAAVREGIA